MYTIKDWMMDLGNIINKFYRINKFMKKTIYLILILSFLLLVNFQCLFSNDKQKDSSIDSKAITNNKQQPLVDLFQISSEAIGGSLLGVGMGYLNAEFLSFYYQSRYSFTKNDYGFLNRRLFFQLGGFIGSSLAVFLIGNIGDQTGDIGWTFFGGAIGSAVTGSLFFLNIAQGYHLMCLPSTIGATIAFNITRKYKKKRNISFFINPINNGLSFNLLFRY